MEIKGGIMNLILCNDIQENVVEVIHRESQGINGYRIVFINEYSLSIVKGDQTYSDSDTFEIALIKDGSLVKTFGQAGVLGHQSLEDIRKVCLEVIKL